MTCSQKYVWKKVFLHNSRWCWWSHNTSLFLPSCSPCFSHLLAGFNGVLALYQNKSSLLVQRWELCAHTSFYISEFPLKSLSLKSLCPFAPNFGILWCGLTQGCTTKQMGRAIDLLCMSGLWCISPAVLPRFVCFQELLEDRGLAAHALTSIHDPFVLGGQRVCSWGTLPHLCLV